MTNSVDESAKMVLVGRTLVPKYDVPLGKEYAEDDRVYQTTVTPGTYTDVLVGGRFRYGDKWFYKDEMVGAMPVEPNMPFGHPFFLRHWRGIVGGERVSILQVEDRGPASK